jgi:hypothetical protein
MTLTMSTRKERLKWKIRHLADQVEHFLWGKKEPKCIAKFEGCITYEKLDGTAESEIGANTHDRFYRNLFGCSVCMTNCRRLHYAW